MTLNLLAISVLGLVLVGVGLLLRARGKARDRYVAKAKEAGVADSELDDVYYTYRINRELVGMRRRDFINLLGCAAVIWPLAAHTKQSARERRVGVLAPASEADLEVRSWIAAFVRRLQELGWREGQNVSIDYRFAEADTTRLRKLAKELVESQPDAIFTIGTNTVAALREQTLSIPIVFVQVPDPVATGFVTSLARPNGNITGFTNFEFAIGGKWLQAIKESAPAVNRVLVIFDAGNPSWPAYLRTIEAAAPSLAMQLTPAGVSDVAELETVISTFAREPNGALIVLPGPLTILRRESIIALAVRHRLPAMYPYRMFALSGGFISYGVDLPGLYRRAASYVDRILKGAKPADLPVQQPTKYELVINLKTAKALGITIPQSLLVRANEVIR